MIEKLGQEGEIEEFVVTCDDCGYWDTHGVADWQELIERIKEDGWGFRKVNRGKKWENMCPECNE